MLKCILVWLPMAISRCFGIGNLCFGLADILISVSTESEHLQCCKRLRVTNLGQHVAIVVVSEPTTRVELHAVVYPAGQYSPGE